MDRIKEVRPQATCMKDGIQDEHAKQEKNNIMEQL
jgi:hypothetical protein